MKTPFLNLIREGDFPRVARKIRDIVWESFIVDARRYLNTDIILPGEEPRRTKSEVQRRTHICEKWIRIMRGDMGFGLEKTLDLLEYAMRSELDGKDFEPRHGPWSVDSKDPVFMTDLEKQAQAAIKQREGEQRAKGGS